MLGAKGRLTFIHVKQLLITLKTKQNCAVSSELYIKALRHRKISKWIVMVCDYKRDPAESKILATKW